MIFLIVKEVAVNVLYNTMYCLMFRTGHNLITRETTFNNHYILQSGTLKICEVSVILFSI